MGFLTGLTLIFITLKLTGLIVWSWWLVMLPAYPFIIVWSIIIFSLVIYGTQKEHKRFF